MAADAAAPGRRYLEDLEVGARFGGETYAVEEAEMLDFAKKWDPRPLHLDPAAGVRAGFGGIIGSGAYLSAILTLLTMRARKRDGDHAVIAAMESKQRIPHPVRAGDVLRYDGEILEMRESKSRADAGIVHTRSRLINQEDAVVLEAETVTLVERRPAQARAEAP